MYSKSLELMELREVALAARQKAERARQLAARGGQRAGAVFEQQALELEARAAVLETRMEQFQARIKQENGATPRAAKGHRCGSRERGLGEEAARAVATVRAWHWQGMEAEDEASRGLESLPGPTHT